MSFRESRNSSGKLFTYNDILLRTYIDISTTGNLEPLIIEGRSNREELLQAWEEIVRENGERNGDRSYSSYFRLLKGYGVLLATYSVVKISLLKLAVSPVDCEVVFDLRRRGYQINMSDNTVYAESIRVGLRKVDNLITRIRMKKSELEAQFAVQEKGTPIGFEEIIAKITSGLGFVVQDNITLARYNEYKKILKEKSRDHGRRNK